MFYDIIDFFSDAWGRFIGILCLVLCILTAYLIYNVDIFSPPIMPTNTQELSEWSEDDLYSLHKSERCDELSEFYAGRVEGTEALMKRCKIISKWWISYDDRQEAKRLEILADDLRKYTRENFVD